MSTNTDEEALIERLKSGDNAAFQSLIAQHQPRLLIIARSIVGEIFAEDVVQDAWSSVYRAIAKFEGRSSLSTWIIQIVSNEAKSRLRREKRHMNVADIEELGHGGDSQHFDQQGHWSNPPTRWEIATPELMLQESELQKCIEHTLSVLPEKQKAVFLLRDVEQHALVDISEVLGLSDNNVRVLLHRARLRLMQVVDHYQETGEC
ncbi:RNA polymerase sigma factor, sigma-70 family [Spongiibacter sp. IMCC21906]|uniref:RNA polymerase sigma factor n=1 Tax=Spongiibacter sp. IMCC21906 TaxID=1620392 RepID=UPI00062DD7C5|nr:sigma-70 family RNA polymerase sigma factor [Spongiibacter sp. IMCC21906]AKH68735.1 RNA polymerase sigma factor, sigma-70 family [Spongiibacter sp. IMCC21906]